tara:strand:- start:222558 stop:223355 length:798 start_codon:yes stop_codon:yes gene_type:complete
MIFKALRYFAACAFLLLAPSLSFAAVVGDIGFIGFNVDGDDDFAIVVLSDLTNETIFFSDDEPGAGLGSGISAEGVLQWETGATTIPAGSVVIFTDTDLSTNPFFGSSVGTLTRSNLNMNLAQSGDSIYAFQGTSTEPTQADKENPSTVDIYLTAIASDDFGEDTTGSLAGTGLVAGVSAIEFDTSTADAGSYIGPRSGKETFAEYFTLINDPANWDKTGVTGNGETFLPFDATPFTISAVPEPSAFSLLITASAASVLRRRNRS